MLAESADQKLKKAFEEVLKQFNISLEPSETLQEEQKEERYGDYSEIISKTQQKLDELNEKAETLLEKTGMTREELEIFASNPANFTTEQWEAIQKLKTATEEFKNRAQGVFGQERIGKTIERKPKKQQHRFGKKKHWIPL